MLRTISDLERGDHGMIVAVVSLDDFLYSDRAVLPGQLKKGILGYGLIEFEATGNINLNYFMKPDDVAVHTTLKTVDGFERLDILWRPATLTEAQQLRKKTEAGNVILSWGFNELSLQTIDRYIKRLIV